MCVHVHMRAAWVSEGKGGAQKMRILCVCSEALLPFIAVPWDSFSARHHRCVSRSHTHYLLHPVPTSDTLWTTRNGWYTHRQSGAA